MTDAIRIALTAQATAADLAEAAIAYGRWGVHRAYVVISGLMNEDGTGDYSTKARKAAIRKLQAAGAKIRACHGCGNDQGIYLGYDNCEGGKLAARGYAISRALRAAGFIATVDACGD